MKYAEELEALNAAEKRVVAGRKIVRDQAARVAHLERDGHDTLLAREVLATLRENLEAHEAGLGRLLQSVEQMMTAKHLAEEDQAVVAAAREALTPPEASSKG